MGNTLSSSHQKHLQYSHNNADLRKYYIGLWVIQNKYPRVSILSPYLKYLKVDWLWIKQYFN